MILHLLISWSRFLNWLLFIADLGLMAFLAYKAFCDAEILDRYDNHRHKNQASGYLISSKPRYEIPFFGRLASRIVDEE